MNVGLRSILLIVAIVLFVLAALTDASGDLLAFGLACLAAAFVVDELGIGARVGSRR